MPLWGTNDAASNSTIYAAAQLKQAPNTANRDSLFGNTTANAYFDGVTVGQYGVDANEVAAGGGRTSHTGWVLRTTGQGGRSGRVFDEVLVAGGMSGDAEDVAFPDYRINITTQPVNTTINATTNVNNTGVIFTVASTVPAGGTITYLWQANTGSGFVNAAAGTTGNTTENLTFQDNSFSTGAQFRVLLQATGAVNVTSSVATLTVNT